MFGNEVEVDVTVAVVAAAPAVVLPNCGYPARSRPTTDRDKTGSCLNAPYA